MRSIAHASPVPAGHKRPFPGIPGHSRREAGPRMAIQPLARPRFLGLSGQNPTPARPPPAYARRRALAPGWGIPLLGRARIRLFNAGSLMYPHLPWPHRHPSARAVRWPGVIWAWDEGGQNMRRRREPAPEKTWVPNVFGWGSSSSASPSSWSSSSATPCSPQRDPSTPRPEEHASSKETCHVERNSPSMVGDSPGSRQPKPR